MTPPSEKELPIKVWTTMDALHHFIRGAYAVPKFPNFLRITIHDEESLKSERRKVVAEIRERAQKWQKFPDDIARIYIADLEKILTEVGEK